MWDEIASVARVLNEYSNLGTALATMVLATLTILLFWENRMLRLAGGKPDVVAYLQKDSQGKGTIELVLANVGKGPAFNVAFELLYDEEDFVAHEALLHNDDTRKPFSVMPQGEQQRIFMGIGYVLYGAAGKEKTPPLKPFVIRISYASAFDQKRKITSKQTIDITQFAGLRGLVDRPPSEQMTLALQGIERSLEAMAGKALHLSKLVELQDVEEPYIRKLKSDDPSE